MDKHKYSQIHRDFDFMVISVPKIVLFANLCILYRHYPMQQRTPDHIKKENAILLAQSTSAAFQKRLKREIESMYSMYEHIEASIWETDKIAVDICDSTYILSTKLILRFSVESSKYYARASLRTSSQISVHYYQLLSI